MTAPLRRPCRACGAPLLFVQDAEGKTHPLDTRSPTFRVERDLAGDEIAVRSDAMVSHFATCPKASDFSKGRKP